MTKAQITKAMKGATDPVVLRVLDDGEDPARALAILRERAPAGVALYLRRAGVERDRTVTPEVCTPYPAAVLGRNLARSSGSG